MKSEMKNLKISEKHHEMLKTYCDNRGLKMYKVIERFIEDISKPKEEKPKRKDIYGDD